MGGWSLRLPVGDRYFVGPFLLFDDLSFWHCCVVRWRGAFVGSNAVAGSDHHGEFVERGCHSEVPVVGVDTEQYANNRVETDHGRLKARLRPMRGLKRDRTTSVVIRGHAFIQNLRRGHYELGVNADNRHLRVAAALDELAVVI